MSSDSVGFWVFLIINAYAGVLTLVGGIPYVRRLIRNWRTRHVRRVWGFKDGATVIVVCSELDDPEERQHVEEREFIYNLKYGDVDAYFETVITLLRLYPKIKLRIMSAGEAETTPLDLARHLVVIGGPDYNTLAGRVLSWNLTQFDYRSSDVEVRSQQYPDEIVLYDKVNDNEYCYETDSRDFGYFERIVNPHNSDSRIVLIGGCHTIGVTGAVKAFSVAGSDEGEVPQGVLRNAALVASEVGNSSSFSVLVDVERVGQTISTPVVDRTHITVRA